LTSPDTRLVEAMGRSSDICDEESDFYEEDESLLEELQ
jgi:hypothetical protein